MIDFDYTVKRSRRRTVVISVCCGEVVVKVPVQMTDATVERFLESKRTWVIKKLAQQAEVSFESVRAGKNFAAAWIIGIIVTLVTMAFFYFIISNSLF